MDCQQEFKNPSWLFSKIWRIQTGFLRAKSILVEFPSTEGIRVVSNGLKRDRSLLSVSLENLSPRDLEPLDMNCLLDGKETSRCFLLLTEKILSCQGILGPPRRRFSRGLKRTRQRPWPKPDSPFEPSAPDPTPRSESSSPSRDPLSG